MYSSALVSSRLRFSCVFRAFCTESKKFPVLRATVDPNLRMLWSTVVELASLGHTQSALSIARTFAEHLPDAEGFTKRAPLTAESLQKCIDALGPRLPESQTLQDLIDAAVIYEKPGIGQPRPVSDESDIVAVETSFTATKYQNSKAVRELYEELQSHALKWKSHCSYYAPYTALVNASMTGKSRLLTELRREGVFLFYICLRISEGLFYIR